MEQSHSSCSIIKLSLFADFTGYYCNSLTSDVGLPYIRFRLRFRENW